MTGIIGTFRGIPIAYCKCGGKPCVFGEGLAREDYNETNKEFYFTDFYGYCVECDECGEGVYDFRAPERAIEAWNERMKK